MIFVVSSLIWLRWQPDVEEEFEDSVGNVLNRQTFDDMRRQGIL